jgi:N6-L-threonylcarbamoyladenine synthase
MILKMALLVSPVFSQIKMHAEYGGVVPELASRDHCVKIVTVLEEALGDIDINTIDQIALYIRTRTARELC